jgi:hypothetical protein
MAALGAGGIQSRAVTMPVSRRRFERPGTHMAGLYLLHQDNRLVEFTEAPYDSAALLQELLQRHPRLLAGELVDSAAPRRWLLVKREAGIPDGNGAANRWSIDHLYLDQDGVPTLVEVKRSTDTRIRREVVGQMLDYAANSVVCWSADKIREQYMLTHQESGDTEANHLARPSFPGKVSWPWKRGPKGHWARDIYTGKEGTVEPTH